MRTRAGITIKSWNTRRPRGTRSGLRIRARRLACSTLPTMRVVVGMVSAGLSSPNRSIGCAQGGVDFMGSACRAGFAACIAWSARAGVVARGGRRPGTRAALLVWQVPARGENHRMRRNLIAMNPTRRRFIYGTHTVQITAQSRFRYTGESYQFCPTVPQSTTNAGRFASGGGAALPPRGPRVRVRVRVRIRVVVLGSDSGSGWDWVRVKDGSGSGLGLRRVRVRVR